MKYWGERQLWQDIKMEESSMGNVIIKRRIPLWVVWVAAAMNIVFLSCGIGWLFLEFDLPILNSGDKYIVWIITGIWWLLTSVVIFGWRAINR